VGKLPVFPNTIQCLCFLEGSKRYLGFPYPQIYCQRRRQTRVRDRKLLPMGDDRRQRHQNSDKRIPQAA